MRALLLLLLPLTSPAQVVPWPADSVPRTTLDSLRFLRARSNKENLDDLGTAIRTNQHALRLARRLGNLKSIGDTWRALGDGYSSDEYQSKQAQHCYEKALAAGRQARWPEGMGDAYLGMGLVATDIHNRLQALQYFQQAGQQYAAMPTTEMARAFGQLLVLSNLINAYHEMGDDGRAAALCRQAAAVRASTAATAPTPKWRSDFLRRSANLSSSILANQAEVYLKTGQPDSARRCVEQGLRLTTSAKGQANHRITLARIELSQQQPQAAYGHLQEALQLARHSHYIECLRDGLNLLPQVLHALHRPEAYDSLQAYVAFNDTINQREGLDALAQAQARFNDAEQQSQIRDLQQQRRLNAQAQALARQRLWTLVAVLAAVLAGLALAAVLALRLRRSRNALAAARATQDRLYALVAHDLRSPLTAFEGLADLLTLYAAQQDTVRLAGLGSRVQQAAQSLRGLLDNLLGWALQQRGELTPAPAALSVAGLLADTVALYQTAAEAAGVALTQQAPPGLQLWADANMTRTVLRNLVGNALRATPAGGTVALSAAPAAAGTVALTVQDTGPGFGPEQLGGPRPPRPGSAPDRSGLGLRLSHDFATAQGGTLELRNAGGGAGAVLTLPAAPQG